MSEATDVNLSDIILNSTSPPGVLSKETFMAAFTTFLVLTIIGATFGIVCNIFTLIVYFKMRFSETATISLTALTISDLGMNITSIIISIFFAIPQPLLFPLTYEVSVTTIGYPHYALSKVSALITAFLSIERYLCVRWPHKVRQVITHRRTIFIMVIMFTVALLPLMTVYFKYPIGWRYFPEFKKTLIGVTPITDPAKEISFKVYQIYSSVVLPATTYIIITTCTIMLALNLNKRRAWRDASRLKTSSTPNLEIPVSVASSKEAKVIKMVIAIAIVFIVCNIPSCVPMVVVFVVPEFDIRGKYWDFFCVAGSVFFFTDAINTSANVFIYYKLSTRFRQTAIGLLPWKNKKDIQQCLYLAPVVVAEG